MTLAIQPAQINVDNDSSAGDLLEVLFATTCRSSESPPEKIVNSVNSSIFVATLELIGDDGTAVVCRTSPEGDRRVIARSLVPLDAIRVGAQVTVALTGEQEQPVIIGCIWSPEPSPQSLQVSVDQQRLEITAEREIVLRCGEASITLTKAGKIIIHGAYVSSRSSGVNRIRGGSVQIN